MNKKLLKLEIIGFVVVCIVGTVMHFVYEWTNDNTVVGLFCPINESPWEHLKLLYFPFLLYTIITQIKLKQDKFNIWFAGYISIITGMAVTISYYYTLNGALGGNNEWVNISSFFVGVAVTFILNYFLINNSVGKGTPNAIAGAMLIITVLIFFIFTFKPPIIPLFEDPINHTYGI
jgi:uncharacterized protein involved in response to NO